jgi:acetolactate synthase-1/2/3 large subunit
VVDLAVQSLAGVKHLVLAGAKVPVGFFAYPGKPSLMAPSDAITHILARSRTGHRLGAQRPR